MLTTGQQHDIITLDRVGHPAHHISVYSIFDKFGRREVWRRVRGSNPLMSRTRHDLGLGVQSLTVRATLRSKMVPGTGFEPVLAVPKTAVLAARRSWPGLTGRGCASQTFAFYPFHAN